MKLTREVAGIIFESCMHRCYYCGYPQQVFGDWEIDHMTPRQQNGSDALHNLTLACKACNRRKGNRTVEQYRAYIIQRALNGLTDVSEFLMSYEVHEDDAGQALNLVLEAEGLLSQTSITFFGEANNIDRNSDPRFAREQEGDAIQ
jgi:hypothetical protein